MTILLAAGLCARLTRLVTLDVITEPIRRRLTGLLGALVECSWCTGVWVAGAVGLSWWAWADQTWWQTVAVIGTIAWTAGAVSNAAMPSQHEVATVTPVALVNADAPPASPEATTELVAESDLSVAEVEAVVKRVVEQALAEGKRSGGSD